MGTVSNKLKNDELEGRVKKKTLPEHQSLSHFIQAQASEELDLLMRPVVGVTQNGYDLVVAIFSFS
jgi:hypothetical protein